MNLIYLVQPPPCISPASLELAGLKGYLLLVFLHPVACRLPPTAIFSIFTGFGCFLCLIERFPTSTSLLTRIASLILRLVFFPKTRKISVPVSIQQRLHLGSCARLKDFLQVL